MTALPAVFPEPRNCRDYLHRITVVALCCVGVLLCCSAIAQEPTDRTDTAASPGSETVIVNKGDTLESISRDYFDTTAFWRHIAEYNNLNSDNPLLAGQIILIPVPDSIPLQHATVVYVHGDALIFRSDAEVGAELQREDRVYPTDNVKTGGSGFVSIAFGNGSVINLQPNSDISLQRLLCLEDDPACLIDVVSPKGELGVDVDNRANQTTEFHLRTPFASAAVRGTTFDFVASPEKLLLGVTEGLVDLSAEGDAVALEAGFGSVTQAGEPPGQPRELLYPPTYTNIPPRLAPGDRLGWWRIPEASQYLWSISRDANGGNVVTSDNTEATFFELPPLAADEYYLSVRGVDAIDLKGFPTVSKIQVAEIDPALARPDVTFSRSDRELSLTIVDPQEDVSGYEIQLASTANFDDVISIDVGPSGQAIFADIDEKLYIRARALISPQLLSAFGATIETD